MTPSSGSRARSPSGKDLDVDAYRKVVDAIAADVRARMPK